MKQKKPIDVEDLDTLERFAKNRFGENSDTYKSYMIFRYTGCHVSVLCESKRKLREEKGKDGKILIIWYRPKKKGEWARVQIIKHRNILFDINEFSKNLYKRKKKNNRLYWYRKMTQLGEKSGIKLPDDEPLSPNSLRHSLAIYLLNQGWTDTEVAQLLNVSRKTLAWYGRHTNKGINDKLEKAGW